MTRCEKFKDFKIVTNENQVDKNVKKPNFNSINIINENLAILEMNKTSVTYSYPLIIGSLILQNSKVHMYLYKIYPKVFGNDFKVLYIGTDSIYAKLNITHQEYVEILEKNENVFGDHMGQIEPECLDNPIQEGVFLSSKSYSYICKNDIPNNKHKIKNNILHTKGILNSYSQKYIDHNLFKQALLNNNKPDKISLDTISVKN